jgi:MFS family permease
VELKTVFVISQIVGYAASKFIGIKVCSEAARQHRWAMLVLLVVAAEAALLLFAIAPVPWKAFAIFLNGLPLGMVWGLVVRYLEGRRTSEILLAGLACSFIVSSGVVKDVGRALLAGEAVFGLPWLHFPPVSQFWMPAATGLIFLPPLVVASWLLDQAPEPSAADAAARTIRAPMNKTERQSFLRQFLPGMAMLIAAYLFLTAFRDFRDSYMVEILDELGYSYADNKNAVSQIEAAIAIGVMAMLAALFKVLDNRSAMICIFFVIGAGLALVGIATVLWRAQFISGFTWLFLIGLGSYLAYVPYNTLLFDRLIAMTGVAGTAVFAIYLADALGYTGSVLIQIFKDVVVANESRSNFLARCTIGMSTVGTALTLGSAIYFLHGASHQRANERHEHEEVASAIAP